MMPQVVPINVTGGETISLTVGGAESVAMALEQVRNIYIERQAYDGPYTVTPGAEAQTLSTNGMRMIADVVVGAIPQSYGLITWNGSALTIT